VKLHVRNNFSKEANNTNTATIIGDNEAIYKHRIFATFNFTFYMYMSTSASIALFCE